MRHLVLLLLAALAAPVFAQAWPDRPVTFIVPFPPGGATDIVSRQIAAQAGPRLGQQVVVENRSGAGGTIGTAAIAKAAPDGYTIGLATTSAVAIAPSVYKDLPYDSPKAFAPVIEIARGPYILSVRTGLPVQNVKELIAHAKQNPGKLNFGSPGKGTTHHLSTELLSQVAGLDMVHVPYKGGTPALTDLAAGQIQVSCQPLPSLPAFAKTGRIRSTLFPPRRYGYGKPGCRYR
jgi:tripartite-type tricarboxylate transporter receptor subunit TctC